MPCRTLSTMQCRFVSGQVVYDAAWESAKAAAGKFNTSKLCFSKKFPPKKNLATNSWNFMFVLWKRETYDNLGRKVIPKLPTEQLLSPYFSPVTTFQKFIPVITALDNSFSKETIKLQIKPAQPLRWPFLNRGRLAMYLQAETSWTHSSCCCQSRGRTSFKAESNSPIFQNKSKENRNKIPEKNVLIYLASLECISFICMWVITSAISVMMVLAFC